MKRITQISTCSEGSQLNTALFAPPQKEVSELTMKRSSERSQFDRCLIAPPFKAINGPDYWMYSKVLMPTK